MDLLLFNWTKLSLSFTKSRLVNLLQNGLLNYFKKLKFLKN